jgi:tetratricopeptide (TPR) repeat protein
MIPAKYRGSIGLLEVDGRPTGTAFAIDAGRVVTAAHNVIDLESGAHKEGAMLLRIGDECVPVEWTDAEIDRVNDVGVLRVLGHLFSAPLPAFRTDQIGDQGDQPVQWSAWGYPQAINAGGLGLSGTLAAFGVPLPEGGTAIQLVVDQYESAKMGGVSGAPVVVGENCIGVIVRYPLNLTNGTLFAASLQTASLALPVLAKCLERTTQALPERDPALKAYLEANRRRDVLGEFVMRGSESSPGARRTFVTLHASPKAEVLDREAQVSLDQLLGAVEPGQSPLCLWIEGAPGSGKTTFLKHLARCAWEDSSSIGLRERALPLYARLARVAANQDIVLGRRLLAALDPRDGVVCATVPEDFLDRWPQIASAKWLLLFDGMDEVPSDSRSDVFQLIRLLVDSGHRIVVTSRPDLDVPEELAGRFTFYSLRSISGKEQEQIAISVLGEAAPQFQSAIAGRDYAWLRGSPLLISIAALVFAKGHALPRRRVDLYQWVTEEWLGLAKPRLLDPDMPKDLFELARPVLECVALQMSLNPLQIRIADLLHTVAPVMAALSGRPEVLFRRPEVGGRFLKSLGRYTGFFEVLGDTCGWLHPTFREYFAALRLTEMSESEAAVVFARVTDPAWQQIVLMLITMWSDRKNVDGYFQQIAGSGPDGPLLAAQALFEGAHVSDSVAAESLEGLVSAVAQDAEVSICASLLSVGHHKREARFQAVTALAADRPWFSDLREKLIEELESRCREADLSGDDAWGPQWFKYLSELGASDTFVTLGTDESLSPVIRALATSRLIGLDRARGVRQLESIAGSVRDSPGATAICARSAVQVSRIDLGKQLLTGTNLTWENARQVAIALASEGGRELLQSLEPELVHPRVFVSLAWQYVENKEAPPSVVWIGLQRSIAQCEERSDTLRYPPPNANVLVLKTLTLSEAAQEFAGVDASLIKYSAYERAFVELCAALADEIPATQWQRWMERKDVPQAARLAFLDRLLQKQTANDPNFKLLSAISESAGLLVPATDDVKGICCFLEARFLILRGGESARAKEKLKEAAEAEVGGSITSLDVRSGATRFLAILQWDDGERDACFATLASYLEKVPGDFWMRDLRARFLFDADDYEACVADFDWTLKNYYGVASVAECAQKMQHATIFRRARETGVLADQGSFANYADNLAKRFIYDAGNVARYADALRLRGRYKDAADLASVVLEDSDSQYRGLQVRGACRLVLDPRNALDDLTRAIELGEAPVFAEVKRAYLHRLLGDLDSALKDAQSALSHQSDNFEALHLVGELLMMKGQSTALAERLPGFAKAGVRDDVLQFMEVCATSEPTETDVQSFEAAVRKGYGEGLMDPSILTDEARAHLLLYSIIVPLGIDRKALVTQALDLGRLDSLVERVLPLCRHFSAKRPAPRVESDRVIQEIAAAIKSRGGVTEWMDPPKGSQEIIADARKLLSIFPAKKYSCPMYCQKAFIGGLEAQHRACEVLLKTLLPSRERLILLVRLDEDSQVYGECSFKKEAEDEYRFKFSEKLHTLAHDNLQILVHELRVSRFVFIEETLENVVSQALVRQGLPATTRLL